MAHPYDHKREVKPGKKRAGEFAKHFKTGGAVKATGGEVKALKTGGSAKVETKAAGGSVKPRLDKFARGGAAKKKGHHTHINIMVAPKGGDGAPPPLGAGGPPPVGAPPMVPKGPMPPPPGGPMGAGPPGMPPGIGGPKPPGMMKRGGKVYSGISSKANIEHWAKRTGENTKYAKGGAVTDGAIAPFKPPHMEGGAGGARGRMDKKRAYGITPNTKSE